MDGSIDGERLWSDLMALAEITDPERPYTRRSFSARFLEGREWLKQRFEHAGLAVRLDAAGNLIGRREGATAGAQTIMLGSHSDTVPSGGRFDGVAGLIAALEVARSLRDAGYRPRHAIEVVDFLAEEPSEYGLSCVGSRGMAGLLDQAALDRANSSGESLGAAIDRVGGCVSRLHTAQRNDVSAFIELHIEQGAVLETKHIDLGLVTALVGITRIEIVFGGQADHAGTTPMDLRRDAAVAAARTVLLVADRAARFAEFGRGHFVATVGIIEVTPNAANVVPEEVRLIVDIRAESHGLAQEFVSELERESVSIACEGRVERKRWRVLSNTTPVVCDDRLLGLLDMSAKHLGLSVLRMGSGAGHDTAFLARVAPSAMVFVPCRQGRSHSPQEWAEREAIAAGVAVVREAVMRLDSAEYASRT